MEVDLRTPLFRETLSTTSYTAKRRRSDDDGSPSPLEPHSKRMLLADERADSPTVPRWRGPSSGSTSRYSSEDWVQQADSLTIDSPLSISHSNPTFGETQHVTIVGGAISDEMTMDSMDSDETMGIYRPSTLVSRNSQRSPPRPRKHHIQITTADPIAQPTPPVQYQPHPRYESTCNTFSATPSDHTHSLPPQSEHTQPPTIFVLPATPRQSPLTPQDQAFHQAKAFANSPTSPMSISSPTPTVSNRKQRFTMGPRSDCEKCRLGVKGHWMHVD